MFKLTVLPYKASGIEIVFYWEYSIEERDRRIGLIIDFFIWNGLGYFVLDEKDILFLCYF